MGGQTKMLLTVVSAIVILMSTMSNAHGSKAISGAKLRALREYAGLDQTDVAAKAGIDRSTFSQMETGKRPVANCDALRIIRAIETLRARNGAKFDRAAAKLRELLQREEAVA